MPTYLILVIAVVVGVDRSRKQITRLEGFERGPRDVPPRGERWRQAGGVEKSAFIVMGLCALFWSLLVLPIGFAAAVVALAVTVWKRPYLETTLAPVAVVGGAMVALYDVVLALVREGDGGWGAMLVNAALLGGLWVVIGLLLQTAGRRDHGGMVGRAPANHGV